MLVAEYMLVLDRWLWVIVWALSGWNSSQTVLFLFFSIPFLEMIWLIYRDRNRPSCRGLWSGLRPCLAYLVVKDKVQVFHFLFLKRGPCFSKKPICLGWLLMVPYPLIIEGQPPFSEKMKILLKFFPFIQIHSFQTQYCKLDIYNIHIEEDCTQ